MHYFGTDGIRTKADTLLSNKIAYFLGRALASENGKVIVARDVRTHSPAIEKQLCEGLMCGCTQIWLAGILPTPALSYTAKVEGADYAIMITASHNSPEFNGLKVFGKDGKKLTLSKERELDENISMLFNASLTQDLYSMAAADCTNAHNRIHILEGAQHLYIKHLRKMFARFDGIKVRLDCAYGCMAQLAQDVFESLGASVIAENDERNGELVNVNCGSTHMQEFIGRVRRDELGFSFDGDGDRVLCVADGKLYDGDAILLALSTLYRLQGKLRNKFVVGTLLTNSRLQRELAFQGTALMRADVGDKYILDALRETDCLLGGEKSGHIIMRDRADTGDGLITALSLMEVKKTIGSLPKFSPYPMREYNIPCPKPALALESGAFCDKLVQANEAIGNRGRIILRPSGTEPYVRLAIECYSDKCNELFDHVRKIFGII